MRPKILAPVGDLAMLAAAIDNGANEIYFGTKMLNMRATAKNFELAQLKTIAHICHKHNVKAYCTLNTTIYNNEIATAQKIITEAKKAGIDGIICWDMAVISLCKQHNIAFHISTQAGIANAKSAQMYKDMGAQRIVLARECNLEHIKEIIESVEIEVEVFVHGAMCVRISGRCFMSHFISGKSANRGECIQPCRREYDIFDPISKKKLTLENHHIMSPQDLCALPVLDKLVAAGIGFFKIEGRNKQAEYVAATVDAYKKALDALEKGEFTTKQKEELVSELQNVYNRGLDTGFYEGMPSAWDDSTFGKAKQEKQFVGLIKKVYNKIRVVEIHATAHPLSEGNTIMVQGKTSGSKTCVVKDMQDVDDKKVDTIHKATALIKLPFLARPGEKVFVVKTT